MTISRYVLSLTAASLLWTATAGAQTPQATTPAPTSDQQDTFTRPATTTFFGDTGLWYVPTAEVLSHGKWSVSAYRRGQNYVQAFANVSDFAATFAYGVTDRVELFGSFLVDTRIERDLRPIFTNDPAVGGILERYPRAMSTFTGDNVGDLYVGAKVNLLSEARQNPAAVALRLMAKLPTGNKDIGTTTGKPDFRVDLIASKEAGRSADITAFGGYEFRGKPDGFDSGAGAFNWGAGIGIPSRSPVRFTGEISGTISSSSSITVTGSPLIAYDGSISPVLSNTENLTQATLGLTWQMPGGFFLGSGVTWNVPAKDRATYVTDDTAGTGDFVDFQVRLGYYMGARQRIVHPAPPAEPVAPMAPANRPPTVHARCEPCTVQVGGKSTVTADAQDPDGDALVYRWTAPTGTFGNQADRQTVWTAPQQEGPVPVTITVNDGKGGTATDMVTIQVVRPAPVVELNFEDVYFDFDRSTLRPEALRLLDDAVTRLQANPGRNIVIEGHTCNIGTAEYNLALGERRAASVREYLLSRGVQASRLETRSYGEEMPKFDNAREETRRLNRRAALVVKVQ